MARQKTKDLTALLDEEAEAIEADRDAPITNSTVSRGNGRSKTLQIRLNPEELDELERIAADRGLPTSTIAREAILRLIHPEVARSAAASRLVDEFARYVSELRSPPSTPSFKTVKPATKMPARKAPAKRAVDQQRGAAKKSAMRGRN